MNLNIQSIFECIEKLVHSITRIRPIVQMAHHCVLLGSIQAWVMFGDENILQQKMQNLYCDKNHTQSWFGLLFNSIAKGPQKKSKSGSRTPAGNLRAEMLEDAHAHLADINANWKPIADIRFSSLFWTEIGRKEATMVDNIYLQYPVVKDQIYRRFVDSQSGEFDQDLAIKVLLPRGRINARKAFGFPENYAVLDAQQSSAWDRVELWLLKSINALACEGKAAAIERAKLFVFTNLLLEDGEQYRLSPLAGFTVSFVGITISNLHWFLFENCSLYKSLVEKTQFSRKAVTWTEDLKIEYFAFILLDFGRHGRLGKMIGKDKPLLERKFLLNSEIQTDGKSLHISYIDLNKPKKRQGMVFAQN